MKKVNLKLIKVFGLSVLSFTSYLVLNNSNKVNSILFKLQESDSSRGFGIYITIHLGKWFLLIFGIVSLILIISKLFIEKED